MIVEVKQKHIRKARAAIRNNDGLISSVCPIAQALRDFFPKQRVIVGTAVVKLHSAVTSGLETEVSLPNTAKKFITAFDEDKPVKPFRFRLVGLSAPSPAK